MNTLAASILEFHILQSFPVSCLNRDDTGTPKTAIVGGVNRARVSSQCWKRAVRFAMHELGADIAVRTKKVTTLLIPKIMQHGVDLETAEKCAKYIDSLISDDALIFLSDKEYDLLVELFKTKNFVVADATDKDKKNDKKEIEKLIKGFLDQGLNAVDIALFGRMVAKINTINIEAASSFSHALSVHKAENELDFFSALDDFQDGEDDEGETKAGAAHIGDSQFNSATYYRYVKVNLGQLAETLFGKGDIDKEQFNKVLEVFIKALYIAVPVARQNTQSASCTWDYAKVYVRKGQGVQLSLDKPVVLNRDELTSGYVDKSIEYLNTQLELKEKISGSLFGKKAIYNFGQDPGFDLDTLISNIQKDIGNLL